MKWSDRGAWALSTGVGFGYFPVASGTVGTLWGVALFALSAGWPLWVWIPSWLLLFSLSLWAVRRMETRFGDHDSGRIVVDEILGYLVAVAGFAFGWKIALWGFVWFRLLDILKPPPIRQLDRHVSGAWGVILDDVAAGLAAQGILRIQVAYGWL